METMVDTEDFLILVLHEILSLLQKPKENPWQDYAVEHSTKRKNKQTKKFTQHPDTHYIVLFWKFMNDYWS